MFPLQEFDQNITQHRRLWNSAQDSLKLRALNCSVNHFSHFIHFFLLLTENKLVLYEVLTVSKS